MICVECGGYMQTAVLGKKYCTERCRQNNARKRKRLREGPAATEAQKERTDVFMVRHNPTREDLTYCAMNYVMGLDPRPSIFTGNMPEVLIPAGVTLEQSTFDFSWIMQRVESAPTVFRASVEAANVERIKEPSMLDILDLHLPAKPTPTVVPIATSLDELSDDELPESNIQRPTILDSI